MTDERTGILAELGNDGYPTEATLSAIRGYEVATDADRWELLEHVAALWSYPIYITMERPHFARFSTGGWSGNEDLIEALRDNHTFWLFAWGGSARGGHHVFVPGGRRRVRLEVVDD